MGGDLSVQTCVFYLEKCLHFFIFTKFLICESLQGFYLLSFVALEGPENQSVGVAMSHLMF